MLQSLVTVLVTVLMFGVLIFVHELGHYIFARKFGVGIIEFSIGMGPAIKTWKGKYNDFSIRAIPIGGFVNMVGETDEEIPEEHKYKLPIDSRPVWKRIIIVIAGPIMNLLLALLIMLVLVATGRGIGSTVIGRFADNSVSQQYGLQLNDEIVEINGKTIHCYSDMAYKIASDGIEPMDIIVVRRDGEGNASRVQLQDVRFGQETEEGVAFGTMDFYVYGKPKTVGNVLYESFWQSVSTVYMTLDSLKDTFTGRYGMEAVGGPIAVGGEINQAIEQSNNLVESVQSVATMMVMISISLGVFNLLPIPVLDGGRLLFYIIEAIRRKPMDKKIEQKISVAFTVLLLTLMVFVAFNDVNKLL